MKRKDNTFRFSPSHASQGRLFGVTQLYLMGSWLNPLKSKCGISDSPNARRAQVDKDVAGAVYILFSRPVLFGWACEQFVHFIYHLQHAPLKRGTGRTEWYWNFNPLIGTAFLAASVLNGWHTTWWAHWLAFFTPFIWLEGLLWVLTFRFIRHLTVVAALCVFVVVAGKYAGFDGALFLKCFFSVLRAWAGYAFEFAKNMI